MFVNPVFKPSLLALMVSSYLLAPGMAIAAECPANAQCDPVIKDNGDARYSGKDIVVAVGSGLQYQGSKTFTNSLYLKNNIRVSGDGAEGIYLAKGVNFSQNLNFEGASVISEKGTAIKIDGNFDQKDPAKPNRGLYIKDNSVIQGATNAIDFSESQNGVRIDINGNIKGNIIGNGIAGNKINWGYQGGKKTKALFDGKLIRGIKTLDNYGEMTVVAQNAPIRWESNYSNKDNATMIFKGGENIDLTQPLLVVTGTSTFGKNSAVKFAYSGANINGILGKKMVLLESEGGIKNGDNVTVSLAAANVKSASPLLQVEKVEVKDTKRSGIQTQDSWITAGKPTFNGGVSGKQIVARYGVNYQGGETFVTQTQAGGATQNEIYFSNYVVGYALKKHNETGSKESGQLLALLAQAGDDNGKSAALAGELTPDLNGSELQAALILVDKMRSQIDARNNILRSHSRLGIANNGWNAWADVVGGYGESSDSAGMNGYSLSTYGINVGFDRVFDKQRLLGISLAYAQSNADTNNTDNSKTVDSFETMLYSGWFNDRYFIDGNVNIGRNTNETTRNIGGSVGYNGNTKAKGEYDSLQLGFQLQGGMTFDLFTAKFEPRISYKHQWLRTDDYAEHGSPASLRFHRQSYETEQLGAGYRVYNTYQLEKGQFTPTFSMMAYQDMNTDEVVRETVGLTMDSPNTRLTMTGQELGGDLLEIELNGHLQMDNQFSVSAGVSFYQRDSYDELNLGISTTKRF